MNDGLITVAALSPKLRVADPAYNSSEIIAGIEEAVKRDVSLLVLPELATTASTCGDLFYSSTLINASNESVEAIVRSTQHKQIIVVFGAPVAVGSSLYNCAIVAFDGDILAVVPKKDARSPFSSYEGEVLSVELFGTYTYFGQALHITPPLLPNFTLSVEVGAIKDTSQSSATIIANPISSAELIGRGSNARLLAQALTLQTATALIQANSGEGESTTDSVYLADGFIAERGKILAESDGVSGQLVIGQIDLEQLIHQRRLEGGYPLYEEEYVDVPCDLEVTPGTLIREIKKAPFVPEDLEGRCEEVLTLQALGLKKRLEHTQLERVIIGLSGGLDSTVALLAIVRTFDLLGLDRGGVIAVSMPGFGSTTRTKSNAEKLALALGVSFWTIPIEAAVSQHFKDIDHDPNVLDITYE
ncbi:MAG: nitrilase-related carbon-nitrogen hydrolase, partial [Sphaerochaeta sp.]